MMLTQAGLFFAITIVVAGAVVAVSKVHRSGWLVGGIGLSLMGLLGLVLIWFLSMGAFCTAPPGSACL